MTALVPTLTARALPRTSSWLRDLGLILAGSLFVAILAQISIPLPFSPVPITGQTFAVLLVGAVLGSRRGLASMVLYLMEGALGLPFFAGGSGGVHVLFGATAGYLAGFLAAAFLTGWLAEHGWDRRFRSSILIFIGGNLIIYVFGVAWLAIVLGSLQKAILAGLLPFLIGDALKLLGAALALPAAWRLVDRS